MNSTASPPGPALVWLRMAIRMALFAACLLWPAGTWRWWEAWVVVALWGGFGVAMIVDLQHRDPALLAERMKLLPLSPDQKPWDRAIMLLFLVAGITLYVIPGFDVVRFGWSEPFPLWLKWIAIVLHLPCFVLLCWVMRVNTYLAQVVKIDSDRGHHVITTGPYALVRHPMYIAAIVLFFALPVALGSRYALILSAILMVLLVVRTSLEDRTLHVELEGYPEYARQTPWRLLPGIW